MKKKTVRNRGAHFDERAKSSELARSLTNGKFSFRFSTVTIKIEPESKINEIN